MKNVAIFASGSGTNAQAIIEHLGKNDLGRVSAIFCNNSNAYVLKRAKKYNIPYFVFDRDEFYKTTHIIDLLREKQTDFIVLAGFLWLIPENMIHSFPDRIINIHPALLPKYGGKGMYGMRVHQAVIDNREKESGITIHYVNKNYDEGNIIFQAKCKVEPKDDAEKLAAKIHKLEHRHFPQIVEELLANLDH